MRKTLLILSFLFVLPLGAIEIDICVKTSSADGDIDVGRVIVVFPEGSHGWSEIEQGNEASHRGEVLAIFTLTLTDEQFANLTHTADALEVNSQYVNTTKTGEVSRTLSTTPTVPE